MGVSYNGGTQQQLVFLLKLIILGCFGGTTIFGNTHMLNRVPLTSSGVRLLDFQRMAYVKLIREFWRLGTRHRTCEFWTRKHLVSCSFRYYLHPQILKKTFELKTQELGTSESCWICTGVMIQTPTKKTMQCSGSKLLTIAIHVVLFDSFNMGVSKNRGTPKWMVKIMEHPINPWMIWEEKYTYFRKHLYRSHSMTPDVYLQF